MFLGENVKKHKHYCQCMGVMYDVTPGCLKLPQLPNEEISPVERNSVNFILTFHRKKNEKCLIPLLL